MSCGLWRNEASKPAAYSPERASCGCFAGDTDLPAEVEHEFFDRRRDDSYLLIAITEVLRADAHRQHRSYGKKAIRHVGWLTNAPQPCELDFMPSH
jgi:hypothetical protein